MVDYVPLSPTQNDGRDYSPGDYSPTSKWDYSPTWGLFSHAWGLFSHMGTILPRPKVRLCSINVYLEEPI